MSKINILPAQVYNRIAAGEVVDRPYSVVKELVENAIDAGAGEISVFAEGGGKQLIRVVDNGSGILREDLQAAFLPHATSKIAKADDLERIMTLGFRGEAVASIAAVSKMTITSKVKGGNCYRLCSEGGKLGEIEKAAGDDGTDVCVENLFYNTPVRLKFLKSDKAEETDITNFVSRFILCRPDISFSYYVNGKKVGEKKVGKNARAYFKVVYRPGELVAAGIDKKGNEVCRTVLKSAGEKTTQLRALPELESIKRGDLCYIRLQYTDVNGVWKPLVRGEIKVNVEGGELLALGSACPYNEQGYHRDATDTYFGEALAIIRPAKGAEKITLNVESGFGGAHAEVKIED